MLKQPTISSLSGFMKKLEEFADRAGGDRQAPNVGLLFRGQSNNTYQLLPSIARGGTDQGWDSLLNYEQQLIDTARHRLPDLFRESLSPIDTLALMQHYGIPTRLLDVSENPLAALYFACCGNDGVDGEVIVFKAPDAYSVTYPIYEALADSCNLMRGSETNLADFFDRMIEQPYYRHEKLWLRKELPSGSHKEAWLHECCGQLIHVQASLNAQRQRAQSGRFILFPNRIGPSALGIRRSPVFERRIAPIDKDGEHVFARVRVRADSKSKIRKSLSAVAITEGTLFPDDADKVCKDMVARVTAEANARKRFRA